MSIVVLLSLTLTGVACSDELSTYGGVDEIAAAIQEADLGCENMTEPDVAGGQGSLVAEAGTCEVAGESAQLFTFASDDDAKRWLNLGNMLAVPVVLGPRWVVVLQSDEVAERVSDGIGGELLE